MIVPITDKCNQNCIFCSAKDRPQITDEIIEQQLLGGAENLILSGGEPTLSPKLFLWLTLARKNSSFLELQSNGLTFSYMDIAKKIVEYQIDLFNISFLSHLPEINDFVSNTSNTFDVRVRGIQNLLLLDQKVRLTIIINSYNYNLLVDTVEFIHRTIPGISFIQFSFIKISGAAIKNPFVVIDYLSVAPKLHQALDYCIQKDIKTSVDHIPLCYLKGYEYLHVDIGKIALNNSEYLDEKINLDSCSGCNLNEFCFGPRKDYLNYFNEEKTIVYPIRNEL
jgi:molybdenum cofactor biosynthesis enzyme MoaA